MTDTPKNIRVHIPRELYVQLAHLAVDLPQTSISSLIVEGAWLLLEKYRRGHQDSGRR